MSTGTEYIALQCATVSPTKQTKASTPLDVAYTRTLPYYLLKKTPPLLPSAIAGRTTTLPRPVSSTYPPVASSHITRSICWEIIAKKSCHLENTLSEILALTFHANMFGTYPALGEFTISLSAASVGHYLIYLILNKTKMTMLCDLFGAVPRRRLYDGAPIRCCEQVVIRFSLTSILRHCSLCGVLPLHHPPLHK